MIILATQLIIRVNFVAYVSLTSIYVLVMIMYLIFWHRLVGTLVHQLPHSIHHNKPILMLELPKPLSMPLKKSVVYYHLMSLLLEFRMQCVTTIDKTIL